MGSATAVLAKAPRLRTLAAVGVHGPRAVLEGRRVLPSRWRRSSRAQGRPHGPWAQSRAGPRHPQELSGHTGYFWLCSRGFNLSERAGPTLTGLAYAQNGGQRTELCLATRSLTERVPGRTPERVPDAAAGWLTRTLSVS